MGLVSLNPRIWNIFLFADEIISPRDQKVNPVSGSNPRPSLDFKNPALGGFRGGFPGDGPACLFLQYTVKCQRITNMTEVWELWEKRTS